MIGRRSHVGLGIVLGVLVAAVGVAAEVAAGAQQQSRQKARNERSDALNGYAIVDNAWRTSAAATGGKVTVRLVGRPRPPGDPDVTDGRVAGGGNFTASGAIADKGKFVVYRTQKGVLITLRFVSFGKKGTITFVVKIDTTLGTSRWTIASSTKAYKGLHGKGIERENADYTISTLTGTVSQ